MRTRAREGLCHRFRWQVCWCRTSTTSPSGPDLLRTSLRLRECQLICTNLIGAVNRHRMHTLGGDDVLDRVLWGLESTMMYLRSIGAQVISPSLKTQLQHHLMSLLSPLPVPAPSPLSVYHPAASASPTFLRTPSNRRRQHCLGPFYATRSLVRIFAHATSLLCACLIQGQRERSK